MSSRRRAERDPRETLARLVERLGQRRQYVTLEDVERAARPSSRLASDDLPGLVEGAVTESILLKDLRTFYDGKAGTFAECWVYRVNPRHPLVAAMLNEREM